MFFLHWQLFVSGTQQYTYNIQLCTLIALLSSTFYMVCTVIYLFRWVCCFLLSTLRCYECGNKFDTVFGWAGVLSIFSLLSYLIVVLISSSHTATQEATISHQLVRSLLTHLLVFLFSVFFSIARLSLIWYSRLSANRLLFSLIVKRNFVFVFFLSSFGSALNPMHKVRFKYLLEFDRQLILLRWQLEKYINE